MCVHVYVCVCVCVCVCAFVHTYGCARVCMPYNCSVFNSILRNYDILSQRLICDIISAIFTVISILPYMVMQGYWVQC